jgi:hypothetical protein
MHRDSRGEDFYHWFDRPFWGKEIIILKNIFLNAYFVTNSFH